MPSLILNIQLHALNSTIEDIKDIICTYEKSWPLNVLVEKLSQNTHQFYLSYLTSD